ncbi:phage antirepressor KilAC domain-containing protein [Bacteroides fragilis]|uniref:phage antirepressor KilAC domain-containing protein n=1 Tax=Bacteroides fragilis TaxID=817 RepID=UPI0020309D43|nr:phage regulatory protein/antirepressor Ant [Bacteroides fragilis]
MANLFDVKTMSSLQIAELTGKQHSNVMRDIRNILEQLEDRRQFNFELSSRTQPMPNGGSKEVSCYILTKKDCLLLASGYDANLRAKIINRWEELETKKRELSRKELALMVLQSEEEKERLALEVQQQQITIELQEKEIKQAAPKINYYDNHLQSVNTLTSTQVAKQIGMDAEKLHKKLKEVGIIYKQSGQWLLHAPYSMWGLHSTRTQTYTRSDGSTGTSIYTVWTTKGVRFIIALYENEWDVKKAIKQIKSEVNPAA